MILKATGIFREIPGKILENSLQATVNLPGRILLTILLSLGISGCSFLGGENGLFPDRAGDYTDAEVIPDMRIPPELDSYTLDQLYVIPARASASAQPFEEIPQPKPIEERRREGVVIQRLTDTSWILIDATPGQVWPLVRDYWTELQIALEYENPSSGIMETSWLEIGSDQELRHKYRIEIEPGLHAGYSEIYVTHLQNRRDEPIPTVINWPELSDSEALETSVMTSISQYLADRNDIYQASSASLLAGSIEAASKANIVEAEGGEQVLELRLDYNRAWVQVRQALESAQIEILDSNRDQSFFNVRFAGLLADPDDQPGFIGRLLGRGEDVGEREPQDFSVRLLETDSVINVVAESLEASTDSTPLRVDLLQAINDNLT